MEREKFKSRLGFILLSAGCAIGIGNVWRFPYIVGNYGGGIFVLFYLFFLVVVGIPILTMEFSVGRASRKSIASAFARLEPAGAGWHVFGNIAMIGNYVLMSFYTTVAGWMIYYFYQFAAGNIMGMDTQQVISVFNDMQKSPGTVAFWMIVVVVLGFCVCSFGLQKGVEKITKVMMLALLGLIMVLAIHSMRLDGGIEGVRFYLVPDFSKIAEIGLFKIITTAMNQAFFTLSVGIGSMMIFGSYIDKSRSLLGESVNIALLDTFVAIIAGLIIFPSCFAFGVKPDSGPKLVFITLPNIFTSMMGGRLWGAMFFLFMTFASMSTVIAVFENILNGFMEKFRLSRIRSCIINIFIVIVLSLPCVFGFNIWSSFTPFGEGSTILDLEDFIISNLLLPLGSFICLLFCVTRYGWGFDNYIREVNIGAGLKMPVRIRPYLQYLLPVIISVLFIQGIWSVFM